MTFSDLMGCSKNSPNISVNDSLVKHLFQKNRQVFDELLDQLKRNSVVPLFGAGFSAAFYPSWANLLEEMATPYPNCQKALKRYLASGEYEEAASLLCQEMGNFDFLEELYKIFGPRTLPYAIAKISKERKSISQIFTGPLVTTNVDQVIEELYCRKLPVLCPHTSYQTPQSELALQTSAPLLFKLHGDIEDSSHLVFTKEQYDKLYSNPHSPLVKTLNRIFSSKTILFLGCSLDADRLLDILQNSCSNHVYYALAELPAETQNVSDPFMPKLVNEDNTELEAYRKRRLFMSNHHIKCIWFPYKQYNALDVFLQELQNQFAPTLKQRSTIPIARHNILGRDETIDIVYRYCMEGQRPVFVIGPGGIGKTEVCHLVLRRMENYGKHILYINVTGVQEPSTLCYTITQAVGIPPLPDTQAANLSSYLAYIKDNLLNMPNSTLYLDNWEDLWYALNGHDDQRLHLLEWLADICRKGLPILLSSRVYPYEYDVPMTPYPLAALDRKTGVDKLLFRQVYQDKNGHLALRGMAYENLMTQLDGHPLAIVLAATQAASATSWENVLLHWTQAEQKTINPRHNRLDAALQMSWDHISQFTNCIMVWGLVALTKGDLHISMLMELSESKSERQQWEDGIHLLHDASLLDWSEDGITLQMLQPIKEAFFMLAPQSQCLLCFDRWYRFFLAILKKTRNLKTPYYQKAHIKIVEQLPQILSLLERMLASPWKNVIIDELLSLTTYTIPYFEFSVIQSLSLSEKLLNTIQQTYHPITFAKILQSRGNLFSRLGEIEKAEELYHQAEEIFRKEHNNLDLASALKQHGDLLSRIGNIDKATELYQQTEFLFRQEHNTLGLANTFYSQGALFLQLGELSNAKNMFHQSEELFLQEQYNLGLANTLRSQGDLFSRQGNVDKAKELYSKAANLFRQEHDNLGLANTLQGSGDLFMRLGDISKAKDMFQQAEKLFRLEHDNLGLANTLHSQGDLSSRLGNVNEARELYRCAEDFFRREHDDIGLANTLHSWGTLSSRLGNIDEAKGMYQRAEDLFRHAHDNLGLANILQSKGDLFTRLGDTNNAKEMYIQAEHLYHQENCTLGIANTLQSHAYLLVSLGEIHEADKMYVQAEGLFRQEHNGLGLANTLRYRGDLLKKIGNIDDAKDMYQQAEALFLQEHDNLGLANTLQSRGDLFRMLGSFDKADEIYQQAECLFRQEHDNLGLANTLQSRGDLYRRLGKVYFAEKMYLQAEDLFQLEHSNIGLANILHSRGNLFHYTGNNDKAKEMYQQAEKLFRQEHNFLGLANILQSSGNLYVDLGKADIAESMYKQASELYLHENSTLGLGNTFKSWGILRLSNGDTNSALRLFYSALSCYILMKDPCGIGIIYALLSVALTESDVEKAKVFSHKARSIANSLPSHIKQYIISLLDQ